MLKGIDPRLNADVLYALRAMGHGDVLAVVDMNFPAAAIASKTAYGELLRMENLTAGDALEAILSLMPLDTFVSDFAARMEAAGDASKVAGVQVEAQAAIDAAEGRPRPMGSVGRFDFYDKAASAFAVLQTGERRFYGCFLLRKGVIEPGV